jgi:formiminotetrahydrofolate cyclodeaminase
MLWSETLATFLDRLASADPTPGGGSVAALCGALAAALGSMVANLTRGKPQYAAVESEMNALLQKTEELRRTFTDLIETDMAAFAALTAARQLPRASADEARVRRERLQAATRRATEVPLAVAELAARLVPVCERLAAIGNRNLLSDVGVAVTLAHASAESAAFNVLVNLPALEDTTYQADARQRLETALAQVESTTASLMASVKARLTYHHT